jgi:hypothetical protein
MKYNVTRLALLATIFALGAAEATRIEARDRRISNDDKNSVERVYYKDAVRTDDRVNDIRPEARDVTDRDSEARGGLAADHHSLNSKEANSRGPTPERWNRTSLASIRSIALGDKSLTRFDRGDNRERSSDLDVDERADAERLDGVRDVALLREAVNRNYRSDGLRREHLMREGSYLISDSQQGRFAFGLDI